MLSFRPSKRPWAPRALPFAQPGTLCGFSPWAWTSWEQERQAFSLRLYRERLRRRGDTTCLRPMAPQCLRVGPTSVDRTQGIFPPLWFWRKAQLCCHPNTAVWCAACKKLQSHDRPPATGVVGCPEPINRGRAGNQTGLSVLEASGASRFHMVIKETSMHRVPSALLSLCAGGNRPEGQALSVTVALDESL